MAFSRQLQSIRHQAGLTQEEFAEELQVSRQAVSKWESGRGYPEMEKLLYICSRYQTTLNDLFCEELPVQPSEHCAQERITESAPESSLSASFSSFLSNLSPKNKGLALITLLGFLVLSVLIGLCLKGGTNDMTTAIWIGAVILFGIVEAATAGLTSIWFVLGSVAGLIADVCGAQIWLQVSLFFAVSIASLVFTRPLVARFTAKDAPPTNADRVLGGTARVTEIIDNTVGTGAVYIDGKTWTARSETGDILPVGTLIRVIRMEGVKLFVERCE